MSKLTRLVMAACVGISQAALALPATAPAKQQDKQPPLEIRRKVAEEFGACVAANRGLHSAAVKFVLSGKESDGEKLSIGHCIAEAVAQAKFRGHSTWTYSNAATRSYVADGLVRVDFHDQGPTDFSAVPPLGPSPQDKDETAAAASARALADQIGECAARLSPEEVRRLALTDAASDAEIAQIKALVPTFAQCLPPGVQLAFPPSVLRDATVLAYARLAFTESANRKTN